MYLRQLSARIFAGAVALAVAAPTIPAYADDQRSIALVLDASGSMNARLRDNTSRMDAAKTAVEQLVTTLPASSRLAFRTYGHQSPRSKKDCKDTAVLAPFDTVANNKAAIIKQARALQPQGYTPITYSLTLAAQDLASEEAAAHVVVLVSDGKETCESDPCAAAKALADASAKLVVHTVGVGVDAVTRSQLQCIANNARGSYFDANSAAELSKSLGDAAVKEATIRKTVVAGPKLGKIKLEKSGQFIHKVVTAKGESVADFAGINTTVEVPAGIYGVTFTNGTWTGIEVRAGETTEIKPAYLKIRPTGSKFVEVLEPETGEVVHEVLFNDPQATLIPGHLDVRLGKVLWPGGIELKPGETLTLKPGVIDVKTTRPAFAFVLKTPNGQQAADGFTLGQSRVALPPGKYVLELDSQQKMDVELVEGQELEVSID